MMFPIRWSGRVRLVSILTVLSLTVLPRSALAQVDAIRRAREAIRDRAPSVESLFGKEPPLTTSIDDARDAVPSLDGFEPKFYAPMQEMPRGQDGAILLAPGTYVMVSQSFCLKVGTYGPQKGDGYVHAEWKGPKADLIKTLIQRSAEHPEVPQYQVQLLLWSVLARADMNELYPETKEAAVRLLRPAELLELNGYGLRAVPDALRDRVLQSVPAPARRLLEAENEMRRLLAAADTKYADAEQVAVRTGAIPADEALFTIPEGRWSYHPAGFFIRYSPRSYSYTRIDIHYPDTFEIRRDASGRIISVSKPGGGAPEPDARAAAWRRPPAGVTSVSRHSLATSVQSPARNGVRYIVAPDATNGRARAVAGRRVGGRASRAGVLEAALGGSRGDARPALLALARADYDDLAALYTAMNVNSRPRGGTSADTHQALVGDAMRSALARYLGIRRLPDLPRGSALERSLRPVRVSDGFVYGIAPVSATRSVSTQGGRALNPYQPSQGGATPGGPRQRIATNGKPFPAPSFAPAQPPPLSLAPGGGPDDSGSPDALDKAQAMTDMLSQASDLLGWATDPVGALSGKLSGGGDMLGAGLSAAYSTSRQIGNSLAGQDDGAAGAEVPLALERPRPANHRVASPAVTLAPVSWSPRHTGTASVPLRATPQGGTTDYRSLYRPRSIAPPPVEAGAGATAYAEAMNAAVATTFRMAMALEATVVAQSRLAAAVEARDVTWQDLQGRALLHLKRTAGVEMLRLSSDLETLKQSFGGKPMTTEAGVRARQRALAADGFSPSVLGVAKQLGLTDAQVEAYRRRLLALDPQAVVVKSPSTIQGLQDALYRYGAYLVMLPEIAPPWD